MTAPLTLPLTLIDTHCHLDYIVDGLLKVDKPTPGPTDADSVLARAAAAGVHHLINPGTEPARFARIVQLAEQYPKQVSFALAIHPTDVQAVNGLTPETAEARISELLAPFLQHPQLVALGETGLDYYHNDAPDLKTLQQACFSAFLKLGQVHQLPVIIHDREAHEDVAKMVDETLGPYQVGERLRGVMHCFSGDAAFAQTMVARGFLISFAGNTTFKKAQPLRDAARALALESILVETDAPFLSPEPYRGQLNEPGRTRQTAQVLADDRQISLEALAAATTQNARRLFTRLFF
ncbi:MAG: TatD family hydrolase [Vampirovibrionales bacterium]|nr:TatD family hydrolase [Vampirovibrionales bacterium]